MRRVQFFLSALLLVLGGTAQAQENNITPQVALTLEFYADYGPGGVYIRDNGIPRISCTVQLRFGNGIDAGPHDIYLGVWRPDGSWQTAVGDIQTGYSLQNGFTPTVRGLVPMARYPIRLVDTMRLAVYAFHPLTDPPGIYYGFCLAVRAGEPIVDFKNVRNMTLVPFYWEGRYIPPAPAPQ